MKKLKGNNFLKFFALTLSLAMFSVALIANTLSKYVTKTNAPFDGKDHLNYSVNAVFVVKNQEELFSAINQGYTSSIKCTPIISYFYEFFNLKPI